MVGMTRYLHTMYRITDPEKSRTFYEALGLEFRREFPTVRDGEVEATNYFFGVPRPGRIASMATEEVAGSSPANSIRKPPANRQIRCLREALSTRLVYLRATKLSAKRPIRDDPSNSTSSLKLCSTMTRLVRSISRDADSDNIGLSRHAAECSNRTVSTFSRF
jgi:hypothetical protein